MDQRQEEGDKERHPDAHAIEALHQLIELTILRENITDFFKDMPWTKIDRDHLSEAKNNHRSEHENEKKIHLVLGNKVLNCTHMYPQIARVAKTYRFHARFHVSLIARVMGQLKEKEPLTSFIEEAMERLATERRNAKRVIQKAIQ